MVIIIRRSFQNVSELIYRYRYGKITEIRKAHCINQTKIKYLLLLSIINDSNYEFNFDSFKYYTKDGINNNHYAII